MASNTASDVLGTFGAVFWSIQLIPQIVLNWRRGHTIGLQPSMMLLWAWAGVPLGVYNIISNKNIPLQVQPQILTSLSLVTWAQTAYYGHKWTLAKSASAALALAVVAGCLEVGVILGLEDRYGDRTNVPKAVLIVLAALAASGLALGVLRHYVDIYQHRSVRGISFIFVALDAAGDVTSLASVAIVSPLDVEGSVIYAVELTLWLGILACGVAYNMRHWLGRKNSSTPDRASSPSLSATDSASSVFQTTSAVSRVRSGITQRIHLRSMDAA